MTSISEVKTSFYNPTSESYRVIIEDAPKETNVRFRNINGIATVALAAKAPRMEEIAVKAQKLIDTALRAESLNSSEIKERIQSIQAQAVRSLKELGTNYHAKVASLLQGKPVAWEEQFFTPREDVFYPDGTMDERTLPEQSFIQLLPAAIADEDAEEVVL
jgi:polyhydroxyalkanoate synthesis regulator phasin